MHVTTTPGRSFPIGASIEADGVNFCVFSKHATAIELLLFADPEAPEPSQVITLDPQINRTFYYWHVFGCGLTSGQVYAYRAYGPYAPELGHRFDGQKVLLDPYTRAIAGWQHYRRQAAIEPGDNCAYALRSVAVDTSTYDWENDQHPRTPYAETVIYEMHVGGFTRHPSSGLPAAQRGTFAGVIAKIPYLQALGITAVELLPIHQFDEQDAPPGLSNYWGYSPMAFFAPHHSYSSRLDSLGPIDEFRDMVKALHQAGIEVILDVVFNHTAEGDQDGPTFSFRGFENAAYYILNAKNPTLYSNYSGCGNTLKAANEVVGRMILECLQYWVAEMHVDGFRFDLASVLTRSRSGEPLQDPPILWSIESNPILAGTKIIAEAWDAAGLYQVGSFIGDRFAEWNGPFRDDVRRFVRGDQDTVSTLAARIMGSPDIYPDPQREPNRSINFITCHDGFTLADLVAYNHKHNEANQEQNQDGASVNFSWNCGVEGPTDDPMILELRQQQRKNLLTIMFLSQGTPMLLMGDEIGHTQQGNNNTYCQDNELTWFNWAAIAPEQDFLRFVQGLIQFTQGLALFRQERILAINYDAHRPYLIWHGVELGEPDWASWSHTLAFTLYHPTCHESLHVMLNAYKAPLAFELPPLGRGQNWRLIIDTALPAPADIAPIPHQAPQVSAKGYAVQGRSAVVLMAI